MKRVLTLFLFIFLASCADLVELLNEEPALSNDPAAARATYPIEGDEARVVWVIDGDTIDVEINGEEFRVRYIGIDTPERGAPFYQEATDFNLRLVKDKTVILVKDVSETDRHGRLLRYIYLADGTFVNAELISNGFARVVTFPPDVAETDYLSSLQREAREAGRGLWEFNELNPNAPAGCETCEYNAYNCRDFNAQQDAQACYAFCQAEVGEDIHRLDGGGDGLVCESLP